MVFFAFLYRGRVLTDLSDKFAVGETIGNRLSGPEKGLFLMYCLW